MFGRRKEDRKAGFVDQAHGRPKVWITADGREIPFKDLTNEHLINILNFWQNINPQVTFQLQIEAGRRGLKWGRFKNRPLKDGELDTRTLEEAPDVRRVCCGEFMCCCHPRSMPMLKDVPFGTQFTKLGEDKHLIKIKGIGYIRNHVQFPMDRLEGQDGCARVLVCNPFTGDFWMEPAGITIRVVRLGKG